MDLPASFHKFAHCRLPGLSGQEISLRRLHEIRTDNFEEQERKVLYTIVMESPESVKELSTMMDEKRVAAARPHQRDEKQDGS